MKKDQDNFVVNSGQIQVIKFLFYSSAKTTCNFAEHFSYFV